MKKQIFQISLVLRVSSAHYPTLTLGKSVFLNNFGYCQRYTNRVLQTIQMKLIFLCVWAEPAILGSVKTALKFKYEI